MFWEISLAAQEKLNLPMAFNPFRLENSLEVRWKISELRYMSSKSWHTFLGHKNGQTQWRPTTRPASRWDALLPCWRLALSSFLLIDDFFTIILLSSTHIINIAKHQLLTQIKEVKYSQVQSSTVKIANSRLCEKDFIKGGVLKKF